MIATTVTDCFDGETRREIEPFSVTPGPRSTDFPVDSRLSSDAERPVVGNRHWRCFAAAAATLMFAMSTIVLVGLTPDGNSHATPEVLGDPDEELALMTSATWECGDCSAPVLNSADVVSYFTLQEGEPAVYGSKEYEVVYNGYRFRFVSARNKALFEASPMDYVPAWGGFCAWGISNEPWWNANNLGPETDPNLWLITDDNQLYFFRNEAPKRFFMEDLSRNVFLGDQIWESWFGADASPSAHATGSPLDTSCLCGVSGCSSDFLLA